MKTPKVVFVYSGIYNALWKQWIEGSMKSKIKNIPASNESINILKDYKIGIEKIWRKDEKKIFEEISKTIGLKWEGCFITCFIVEKCFAISAPLTMGIENYSYFIDRLIHELIHKILNYSSNSERTRNSWRHIDKKYKNESQKTRNHIPIFAVMQHIYLKFFNMKRLERHVNMLKSSHDFARAWQIVQQEGYQNIIRDFRKRIK